MENLESRELKFVAGLLRTFAALLLLLMIGSCVGPSVDSQAPPPDKLENSLFAFLAIVFFLSANRIKFANAAAFWSAGFTCLGLGCSFLLNIFAGRGNIFGQILIAALLFVVPTILFRKRHLIRKSRTNPWSRCQNEGVLLGPLMTDKVLWPEYPLYQLEQTKRVSQWPDQKL